MARSSLVIEIPGPMERRRELLEAEKDVRACFLEGHKAKDEPWYPEMIQLLVYSTNRLLRMKS